MPKYTDEHVERVDKLFDVLDEGRIIIRYLPDNTPSRLRAEKNLQPSCF